jgi:hypothetical protein
LLAEMSLGRASVAARDWSLSRQTSKMKSQELVWDFDDEPASAVRQPELPFAEPTPLKAAE